MMSIMSIYRLQFKYVDFVQFILSFDLYLWFVDNFHPKYPTEFISWGDIVKRVAVDE